jgi:hypothetical protein
MQIRRSSLYIQALLRKRTLVLQWKLLQNIKLKIIFLEVTTMKKLSNERRAKNLDIDYVAIGVTLFILTLLCLCALGFYNLATEGNIFGTPTIARDWANDPVYQSRLYAIKNPALITVTAPISHTRPVEARFAHLRISSKVDMQSGETLLFTAVTALHDARNRDDIVWRSTHTAIATVDDEGNVTAIATGITYIIAEVDGNASYAIVMVDYNGYCPGTGGYPPPPNIDGF